ncbi:MAG: rhomboid family intramembrane serine protease [bacterium]|nr:rhomboid family intramembrane serine protease [bacterium]
MFPIKDDAPAGKFPFINLALIGVTVYVFLQELAAPNLDLFLREWALIPSQVDFLNPATLTPFFTSVFLHAGWLHIISNMWFLWIFGDNVEARLGHFNYLIFYIISGIIANFVQYFLIPDSFIPMLGASGAVAGVLGAYFIFFPGHRVQTLIPIFIFPLFVEIPAGVMLIYWFFTQFFAGLTSLDAAVATGGVAWWAHIGGFSFGIIMAKILER